MPLTRLGVSTPSANTDTSLVTLTEPHLVSVIATNKSPTAVPQTRVTIYIVPANASIPEQYAYVSFNTLLSVGQSFETFRFAVNPGDTLFVRSTTEGTSFSCTGIQQDDEVQPSDLTQQFTNKTIRGLYNTVYLDSGNTSQRRVDAEVGYVRYNTEFDALEVRTSQGWEFVGEIVTNYSPDNSLNWDTQPTSVEEALNQLASRVRALEP